ncbi:MAG: hypothetical protein QOE90_2793 [Thermoplasmata archaeon]|jgi:uncharacterized membrane protein YfcA|nr:hypothetical protein [Thermoplasmata archaeon]
MPPRPGPFSRLIEAFHTPPYGRWLEILFWAVAAGLVALLGWWVYRYPNEPLAYLVWLVAACMLLFGLLPQKKTAAPPPPPKGKRGVIAQQVKASKAEKRKGPPPPIG